MFVVGLTGGIGTGKSTVAELFALKGITIIDSDQLTREVSNKHEVLTQIVKKFGAIVLNKDGSLNRPTVRTLIFDNETNRNWLEQLLHPLIRGEMQNRIETSTSSYTIVVIPLLFETTPNPLLDRKLVIDAPFDLQLTRAANRDRATHSEIQKIIHSQMQREERLALADDVIYNTGTTEELIPQVDKLHEFYLNESVRKGN